MSWPKKRSRGPFSDNFFITSHAHGIHYVYERMLYPLVGDRAFSTMPLPCVGDPRYREVRDAIWQYSDSLYSRKITRDEVILIVARRFGLEEHVAAWMEVARRISPPDDVPDPRIGPGDPFARYLIGIEPETEESIGKLIRCARNLTDAGLTPDADMLFPCPRHGRSSIVCFLDGMLYCLR